MNKRLEFQHFSEHQKLCNFVNDNNIKIISISGQTGFITLFYINQDVLLGQDDDLCVEKEQ